MPEIKEYFAGVDALHPSEAGIEARVQEGRRIGMFYHQIGADISQTGRDLQGDYNEYQNHLTNQQTNAGMASHAQQTLNLTMAVNQAMNGQTPTMPAGGNPKMASGGSGALTMIQNSVGAQILDGLKDLFGQPVGGPSGGQ